MVDEHAHDLVGREADCDVLRALAARMISGEGGSAAVVGPPGIGKSALLEHLAESVRSEVGPDGFHVVRVAGTEAESDWPYSGLHLLSAVVAGAAMPGDGARAAASAHALIGRATERPAYDVAQRVLMLVQRTGTPMLVVVDDAHLLDRASRDVLGFVARRLRPVPVVLVVSTDLSAESATPFAGLRTLHLGELSTAEAAEIVRQAADGRAVDAAAAHIAASTGRNPRALLDVVGRVPNDQLEGRVGLDRYLPHSDLLRQMFLPEMHSLDEARRHALLVASLSGDGLFAPVVTALEDQAGRQATWLAQHHLTVRDGSFVFRAPAVRSVVWNAASLEERTRAHLALAEAYADADRVQRLWHRAQAEQTYDDTLAAELRRAAEETRARGEFDRSGTLAREAVRLASVNVDRVEHLILSGQLALHAGRSDEAVRTAADGLRVETTAEQRADLAYLEACAININEGQVHSDRIRGYAEEVSAVDHNRAARLYLLAAWKFVGRMEFLESRRLLAAADRHLVRPDPSTASIQRSLQAILATVDGELGGAAVLADQVAVAETGEFGAAELALCRAKALARAECYDASRSVLHGLMRDGRFANSRVLMMAAYAQLASLELYAGRIPAAHDAATSADHTLPHACSWCGQLAANLIRVHALRGEPDEAWAQRRRAAELSQRTGEWGTAALLQAGTGLQLLLLDRLDEALAVLDRARQYALEFCDPSLLQTEPDFIEVCARQGETDRARDALQEFEARVRKAPTGWAHATLARCWALVAESSDSVPLFREAVDACSDAVSPLELARTQLCFGERLRRLGHRVESRMWLERAVVQFHECGALAFVARAERELTIRTVASSGFGTAEDAGLTAAEHRVAAMAAAGKRNREIAAELYVSSRTVEAHLSAIFRKLGIRSRTELAGILNAAAPARPCGP